MRALRIVSWASTILHSYAIEETAQGLPLAFRPSAIVPGLRQGFFIVPAGVDSHREVRCSESVRFEMRSHQGLAAPWSL